MNQNVLVISEKTGSLPIEYSGSNCTFAYFDGLHGTITLEKNQRLFKKYDTIVVVSSPILERNHFDEMFMQLVREKMVWYIKVSQFFLKTLAPTNVVYVLRSANRSNKINFLFNNAIVSFTQGLQLETKFLRWHYTVYFAKDNNFWNNPMLFTEKKVVSKFVVGINVLSAGEQIINRKLVIPFNRIKNYASLENNAGKTCVITGASGGIGHSIGSFLRDAGYKVHSLSRKPKDDPKIIFHKCDVTSAKDVRNNIDAIYKKNKSIDILVNNSGFGIAAPIESVNIDDFVKMLDVNFFAQIKTINCAMSYLKESKGIIFNIGSMAGIFALPFQVLYSVTKNMIDSYTELMMKALNKNNINICNIMPGDTNTNFWTSRIKAKLADNNRYKNAAVASIANAEKEEKHGHAPALIGKLVLDLTKKKRIPIKATVGKYRWMLFLSKIFTFKQLLFILKLVLFKKG